MLKKLLKEKYTQLPIITQKSLVYSIFDGSFALLHVSLMTSALTIGFALFLGANTMHIALITSFPYLTHVTQIFSAYLEERYPKRKRLVAIFTVFSRQTCWLLPFLPFIESSSLRIVIFLSLTFFSGVTASMSINVWQSWMADLVPANIWGVYFGFRTTLQNITVIVGTLVISHIFDLLQNEGLYQTSFFVLFFCAGFSALTALFFLLKIEEPAYHPHQLHSLREIVGTPFRDIQFRKILFFLGFWAFAIGIAMPFFPVHMIVFLKMKYSTIALFTIIATILSLAAYPFWGKMMDMAGSKSLLWHSILIIAVLPWLWLVVTPDFLCLIWTDAVLSGIYWAAINLGLFNLVVVQSPRQNKSVYLAIQSAVSGIFTFLGAMTGGWIGHLLEPFRVEFFGQVFINNHLLFAASGVLRGCSLVFLSKVKDLPQENMSNYYKTLGDLLVRTGNEILESIIRIFSKNRASLKNLE